MNFLAHALLAGHRADVVVGSLAGDFVKGVLQPHEHPPGVLHGLRLHRRIDAVSNREPALRAAVAALPQELRRYAPPCIDLLVDHYLVDDLHTGVVRCPGFDSFTAYRQWLYAQPTRHGGYLEPAALRFFKHAQATDLYLAYGDWARLTRAVTHVCERMRKPELARPMLQAMARQQRTLHRSYRAAWPSLVRAANDYMRANAATRSS